MKQLDRLDHKICNYHYPPASNLYVNIQKNTNEKMTEKQDCHVHYNIQ